MARVVKWEAETADTGLAVEAKKTKDGNFKIVCYDKDDNAYHIELTEEDSVELAELILEVFGKKVVQSTPFRGGIHHENIVSPVKQKAIQDIENNKEKEVVALMESMECTREEAETLYYQQNEWRLEKNPEARRFASAAMDLPKL